MIAPLSLSSALRRRLLAHATSLFVAFGIGLAVPAVASEPDVMAVAAGSAWTTETQPDLAAFNHWAQRRADAGASSASTSAADLAEGVRLARARATVLAELVHRDPARVIAAGVPAAVRAALPAAVLAELETPFSVVGDYTDYCELRAVPGPRVSPSRHEVKFDGHVHPAYVYGRREGMTTKRNLFLHGVLVGNDAVLDENVLRVRPAAEAARETRAPRDLAVPAGTTLAASTSGPLLAEAGGKLYRFVSDAHVRQAEATLRLLEAHRTPETSDAAEPRALEDPASVPTVPDSAYTTGAKKVIVIRVDFSDLTGDPTFYSTTDTASACQGILDSHVDPYYIHSSYNLTSLTSTVTTQLYRMPRTASDYATNGDNTGLHTDAETLASADYDLSTFDRLIVVFSFLGNLPNSQITYGGLAQVGGPRLWVNGEFDFRVVAHELGHTYGLIHGNLWQVTDGNPASLSGSTVEYGDIFDTMGANYANTEDTDFNAWYKTQLDWLPASQVRNVTASGTYRIYRFDDVSATSNVVALKVVKDGTRNYWVSARRNFTSNDSMTHGVYVTWGYNTNGTQHNVLDIETPGNDVTDAALPTGSAFSDTAAAITITAVDEGGTAPALYEDVRIDVDTNGAAPVVSSATTASGTAGSAFSYQIAASNTPTSFSATGLPPGLSVDTTGGVISGTPTAPGTYAASVSAYNASGTGSAPLSITIATSPNAPTITSFSPPSGPVGTSVTINGTHFTGLQSILFSGNVYAGGSYSDTQIMATVPSGAVTGPITVTTTNGSVSTATNFTVGSLTAPVITSATTASATQGKAFTYQIAATGSPTSFGATGLPSGLTINAAGLISGAPINVGKAAVTISATNAAGTGTGKVTITISAPPVITSAATATAVQGKEFSYQITATNSPTSFGATGLPTGLTISTAGLISGTPKNVGKAAVTITATNAAGTGTGKVTITISAPPAITSATTAAATQDEPFSYQITATNDPTSFAATGLPTGLSINATGLISGTPKNLGTAAVKLSATNAAGTGTGKVTITIGKP